MSAQAEILPSGGRPLLRMAQRIAYRVAGAAGITRLGRSLNRHRVPILCYHSVVDRALPPWVSESGLHLPAEQFEAQIRFLAAHYRVIPLADLVRALIEGAAMPPRAAVITFDDGYANNLRVAAPILVAQGCPATIFLATGYVESGALYWWDELHLLLTRGLGRTIDTVQGRLDLTSERGVRAARALLKPRLESATLADRRRLLSGLAEAIPGEVPPELRETIRPMTWGEAGALGRDGLTAGGHTHEHRVLDGISPADQAADIEGCAIALRRHSLWSTPTVFCYPAGRATRAACNALAGSGFAAAVTAPSSQWTERLAGPGNDLALLPRLLVGSAMDASAFEGNVAGLKAFAGSVMHRRAAPPS